MKVFITFIFEVFHTIWQCMNFLNLLSSRFFEYWVSFLQKFSLLFFSTEYHGTFEAKLILFPFRWLVVGISRETTNSVLVLVAESCLTLSNRIDCSSSGSSVHGILQASILEWVAILFSRGSSWLSNWTWVSCIVGQFFIIWATREAHCIYIYI